MSTVTEIIAYADRYYPNSVSDANKIIDLETIHRDIYNKLKRLTNDFELYTSYTVADQLTYSLPTGCKIENIVTVEVSTAVTGSITSSTEWDTYAYAGVKDDVTNGQWYGAVNDNTIALVSDDLPISVSDYEIRIIYFTEPTQITAVSDTPGLDPQYHNLLKYALIQALASQGHNPDIDVANYWQQKYDEQMGIIEGNLADKFNTAPLTTAQSEEWF